MEDRKGRKSVNSDTCKAEDIPWATGREAERVETHKESNYEI